MMRQVGCVALLVVALVAPEVAQDGTAADAARMQQKLEAILMRGDQPPAPSRGILKTSFTDREVNAYFKLHGTEVVPPGVVDPQVEIGDGGHVSARAIVDLDTALKPNERGLLDPLAWLGGKVEVTAAGTLQAANGTGRLAIERATLGGVAVPTSLLQQLISYYSRTPDQPQGFKLDQPFALPAHIRAVETARGLATITQ